MTNHSPEPRRVLVVDDEATIANSLGLILRASGFETAVVYSGEQAVATARTFRPDIMLTDFKLPGINGIEACVQITQMLPAVRVIMLSGQFMGMNLDRYLAPGYNFLMLSKPLHPAELVRVIRAEQVEPVVPGNRARILNVDDVESHRYSISRLLAHAGFDVTEASTGAEAMQHAVQTKPELILLDIHLPDTDGYRVCAALKQGQETAKIPVMHVTSSEAAGDLAIRSAQSGAEACVAYPVQPKQLVARVCEVLQLTYLRRSPGSTLPM